MHTQKDKCIEWYYQQCYIRIHIVFQSSCRDHGLKKKFMQSKTFQIIQQRARVQAAFIQQNWNKIRFVFWTTVLTLYFVHEWRAICTCFILITANLFSCMSFCLHLMCTQGHSYSWTIRECFDILAHNQMTSLDTH